MKKILLILLIISLNFGISKSQTGFTIYNNKEAGIVMSLGGVAFTTASIIQGGWDYGTWTTVKNPAGNFESKYVIPPFMKQTPRQLMLFTGITLTITGFIHYQTH